MKRGRKSKRTPDYAKAVCDAIRSGLPINAACVAADLSESVFHAWRTSDPQFSEQVKKARMEFMQTLLNPIIRSAQLGNVPDCKWLLTHSFPDEFGNRRVETANAPSVKVIIALPPKKSEPIPITAISQVE